MLENYRLTVSTPECLPSSVQVTAEIQFDEDLTELLPYLNAELGPCIYEPGVPFLRFRRDGKLFAIYPSRIGIAGLSDEDEARKIFEWLRGEINSVARRKHRIEPSTRSLSELKPLDIFKLLPRTNCGECGRSTCMAFAAAIATGEAAPEDCPAFADSEFADKQSQLLQLLGRRI